MNKTKYRLNQYSGLHRCLKSKYETKSFTYMQNTIKFTLTYKLQNSHYVHRVGAASCQMIHHLNQRKNSAATNNKIHRMFTHNRLMYA